MQIVARALSHRLKSEFENIASVVLGDSVKISSSICSVVQTVEFNIQNCPAISGHDGMRVKPLAEHAGDVITLAVNRVPSNRHSFRH